jgi:endonuclease YncB( thermonuclease family)
MLIGVAIGAVIVVIVALLAGCTRPEQVLAPYRPVVVDVIDGDTIDLEDGQRVRLIGIDTPEKGQCNYARAADRLSSLVAGRPVKLIAGARTDKDRYGRLLRYVEYQTKDVGLVLIDEGLARPRYDSTDGYGHHPREEDYYAHYAQAERSGCP